MTKIILVIRFTEVKRVIYYPKDNNSIVQIQAFFITIDLIYDDELKFINY